MKVVVRVKLLPSPEQAQTLQATLHACNRAANAASRVSVARPSRESLGTSIEAEHPGAARVPGRRRRVRGPE
ncbi:hypothetical protein [Nocardiopsis lambiniae]|uniref:hypothetical protein n=1 Tax=Nocardiopsis lambiniae TaxID=3075539 RepID=UPI0028893655|nr:hypothetical protein [Nocardiopsis sp. DSM 44743]